MKFRWFCWRHNAKQNMPALIKPTPQQLRDILVLDGWRLYQEDEYNWSLVKANEPLEVPKRGKNVTFEVLYHCLEVADMSPGRYFELRERVLGEDPPSAKGVAST